MPCPTCSTPGTTTECVECRTASNLEDAVAAQQGKPDPEFTRTERSWTGTKAPPQEGNGLLPDWRPTVQRFGGGRR
ncbi:hypothetical protein [Halorarum salinum]|uniref:Uncharacterized protein n=1 Tax=Halorarum salinum TaxID=2743089 RepID=A0A7D5LCB1_9EURY|nr:hypothetical protein [Halobaculum salinum]QLG63047.1 hypothetical protein HUG12_15430 [Halobaculum salinum]